MGIRDRDCSGGGVVESAGVCGAVAEVVPDVDDEDAVDGAGSELGIVGRRLDGAKVGEMLARRALGHVADHVGLDVGRDDLAVGDSAREADGEVAGSGADIGDGHSGAELEGGEDEVGPLPGVARRVVEVLGPFVGVLEAMGHRVGVHGAVVHRAAVFGGGRRWCGFDARGAAAGARGDEPEELGHRSHHDATCGINARGRGRLHGGCGREARQRDSHRWRRVDHAVIVDSMRAGERDSPPKRLPGRRCGAEDRTGPLMAKATKQVRGTPSAKQPRTAAKAPAKKTGAKVASAKASTAKASSAKASTAKATAVKQAIAKPAGAGAKGAAGPAVSVDEHGRGWLDAGKGYG